MTPPRVAIGLCDGLARSLALDDLRRRLAELLPDAPVEVLPDLCRRPELLPGLVERTAAERLVLALCPPAAGTEEFQAWTRKAGLDPFAVRLVAAAGDVEAAAVRLAAAAARLSAFEGSEPEQLRLKLLSQRSKVSRRSLFTLPPLTYEAVPSVDGETCLGERRCGLCVTACPVAAIGTNRGEVAVDKERCVTCGICVTTCPVGAIANPGASLREVEAELGFLVSTGRPLALSCGREAGAGRPLGAGWATVEVPCLAMVTPGWILQTLAAGAPALALLPCEGCRVGGDTAARERVGYSQEVLRLVGGEAATGRVRLGAAGSESAPPAGLERGNAGRGLTLREPAATAAAVLALAESYGAEPGALAHEASPLGLVRVREETCTLCGACAEACPTDALSLEETAEASILSFEPALCVACGRCVPVCPEGASETIRVQAATDLGALSRGRVELRREPVVLCRKCGRPVAPRAMLERVGAMLEGEEGAEPLLRVLTELCSDCRAL